MGLPLAAIPTIIGAAQSIGGLIGRATNKRPKYRIPGAALRATKLAQIRAQGDMPGYGAAAGNINLAAANALAGARESGRAGEQLQGIVGQTNTAYRDLAQQNAQYQNQADLQYEQSLGKMAQFEDQEWQMNEFAPFADRQQLFEDMIGAGVQNTFEGFRMMDDLGGSTERSSALSAPLTKLPSKTFGVTGDTPPIRPPSRLTQPLSMLGQSGERSLGGTPAGVGGLTQTSMNALRPVLDALKLSFLGI